MSRSGPELLLPGEFRHDGARMSLPSPAILVIEVTLAMLLCNSPTPARASEASEDFNADSAAAVTALQRWYNDRGLWDTTGWWNAAHCVEAIEDIIAVNHSIEYLPVLQKTFEGNSQSNFLNQYYDDEGWWANAWIRAYDLTGEARYLAMAKTIFRDLTNAWDGHCGGGIWWNKDRRYKNAIANELFFLDAVRLHQRTPKDAGPGSYHDWAAKEWRWFQQSGMINAQDLVNDGLTSDCRNNRGTTWSYNQGVIVGALVDWYKVTGDPRCLKCAEAIADATLLNLVSPTGILREPREQRLAGNHDVVQFKGIFIRHLASLCEISPKPSYRSFLLANARSIWQNARNSRDQLGFRWAGPFDDADAARQSSALAALCAVAPPITGVSLGGPCTWSSPGFHHDIGREDAFKNWQADPLIDRTSGFLVRGLQPEARPAGNFITGKCLAQFELKVDNFNWDKSRVATISVIDAGNGHQLAARHLARNQFTNTLYQTFDVPFETTSAKKYDFRVFWYYGDHAPRLAVRSLVVKSD